MTLLTECGVVVLVLVLSLLIKSNSSVVFLLAMGFDASLVTLLGLQLILKTFQSRNEEKLEERLRNKSNEDIEKILLSKNISATRKAINLEKEKRKKFVNQVTKNLKVYEPQQVMFSSKY